MHIRIVASLGRGAGVDVRRSLGCRFHLPGDACRFVDQTDSQVQRLLRVREEVFQDCMEQSFLDAFEEYSAAEGSGGISGMERAVLLLRKRINRA